MRVRVPFVVASSVVAFVVACSSTSSPPPAGDGGTAATCAAPGGPVAGAPDDHCVADGAVVAQPTQLSSCDAGPPADDAGDDGGADNGGSEFGPTMFNAEGDDDDCKYHVKWTSTPLCENGDVTFTVTATKKSDGSPLTGASPYTEIFLGTTHPAPPTNAVATETSPGVYTIGPVRFDAAGRWTVRFHFYGTCEDLVPTSPHGHAAFYVELP